MRMIQGTRLFSVYRRTKAPFGKKRKVRVSRGSPPVHGIKKKAVFTALRERFFGAYQHLPRAIAGFGAVRLPGCAGEEGSAKIFLRTSSRSAKKLPPFTCSISLSSMVVIFIPSLRCALILSFVTAF